MSLKEKLTPATKQRGIGKATECPKCHGPAEYYSPNFVHCERCDAPKAPKAEAADEEKTDPGLDAPIDWVGSTFAWYQCWTCYARYYASIDGVANGTRCPCKGTLHRIP